VNSKQQKTDPPSSRPEDLEQFFRFIWSDPTQPHFLWIRKDKPCRDVPIHSIEEAVAETRRWVDAGWEVFFAPSAFKSHGNRKGRNAASVPGLWFDIDVGPEKAEQDKGYATVDKAQTALAGFCAETGIPEPNVVVRSGGGLHAYWVVEEPFDPETWKATARKLEAVAAKMKLLVDPSRTKDCASLLRPPETKNLKLPTPRAVTLAKATWERLDTGDMLRAVDDAHARFCPSPTPRRRAMVTIDRPHGPPDIERLRTALATQDPDCSEDEWTLRRIAPMARAARDYPELAEDLRALAIEWSGGVLQGTASRKWCEPGGNGLTGEQAFPDVWNRFSREEDREGSVITLGTIFHDARQVQAPQSVIPGDALSLLQGQFFLIRQSGSVWVGDRNVPDQYLRRSDANLILDRVLTARCPGVPPGPIIRKFFSSPRTTEYVGIDCHPLAVRPGYLNVWQGPVLEPKAGDCTRIKAFLSDVLCDGDPALYDYLIKYLAHLIQRPEEKPGVMIILLGGQGAGKGTFGHLVRRMIGELYLETSDLRHVFGDHNDVLERTFVLFFDEFSGSGKVADALKSLATETHVTVNPKNQPVRQIQSFHRLIIASNAAHVKHTDRDDRRDFVLRVSHRHLGDMEYWQALNAEIDGDGTAAFVHELLQLDISDFNVRQRPITKALREQKLLSEDDVGRWLYQCLHEGVMGGPEAGWPAFVATEDVLGWVEDFAGRRRDRRWSRQEIVRRLTQMCPSIRKAQRAVIQGAARRRGLEWPPPEVARNEFEAYIGHPVDWED
jgi:hypothetical protein